MTEGRLQPGTPLRLVPRPDNPYDSTAVEIRLADGIMLGHVPREYSADFFAQVRAGHLICARIRSARATPGRVQIEVVAEFSAPVPRAIPRLDSSPAQPAKGGHQWLWWVIGALILLWLLL